MSDIQEQIKLAHKRAEENDIKLLQEELEYQKQAEIEYNEKHLKLMNMYSDLKLRNEKAIERLEKEIKANPDCGRKDAKLILINYEKLLNILKGDNK